mmetsp:Transcript_7401/g.15060  ORF Transcript_7401/g.15060 Transcript_7401/m.15060 type:complete len:232 (+) Transcript_7401:52-747(+)
MLSTCICEIVRNTVESVLRFVFQDAIAFTFLKVITAISAGAASTRLSEKPPKATRNDIIKSWGDGFSGSFTVTCPSVDSEPVGEEISIAALTAISSVGIAVPCSRICMAAFLNASSMSVICDSTLPPMSKDVIADISSRKGFMNKGSSFFIKTRFKTRVGPSLVTTPTTRMCCKADLTARFVTGIFEGFNRTVSPTEANDTTRVASIPAREFRGPTLRRIRRSSSIESAFL